MMMAVVGLHRGMPAPLHVAFQSVSVSANRANVRSNLVVKTLHVLLQANRPFERFLAQLARVLSLRRVRGRVLAQVLGTSEAFVARCASVRPIRGIIVDSDDGFDIIGVVGFVVARVRAMRNALDAGGGVLRFGGA